MQRQIKWEEQEIGKTEKKIEARKSKLFQLENEVSVMEERVNIKTRSLQKKIQNQESDVDGEVIVEQQIIITNNNIELVHLRLRSTQARIDMTSTEQECYQMKKSLVEKKQLLVR